MTANLPPPVSTTCSDRIIIKYNTMLIYVHIENLNIKDGSPSLQDVTVPLLIQAAGTKALGSFNTRTFMKWKFYVVV
jgi:hypothetical protein